MGPLESILRRYLASEPYHRLAADDLWTRFRDHGDEAAFRVFLERIGGRIYVRCRGILGDDHLAEEAFQDSFLALLRHRGRLPNYRAAVAWLYETATNAARQVRRKRRREARRECQKTAEAPRVAEGPDLDATARQAALTAALVQLPSAQRRALELVYLEGMTHAEAADALGWSRGSVGTYVRRGLERLRQLLGRGGVLAVGGAAALEAELSARAPALAPVLADAICARARVVEPLTVGWSGVVRKSLAVALIVCAGAVATGSVIRWWPADRGTPPPAQNPADVVAAVPESLQEKNLRILRAEVLPRLIEEARRPLPAESPVTVTAVRAFGSEVEVEVHVPRMVPPVSPAGMRLRYCVLRRTMAATADVEGTGKWVEVNPHRPIVIDVPIPFAPSMKVPMVLGRDRWAAARQIFSLLPPDPRAEAELIRHLFGTPGGNILLPTGGHGVSGFPGGLILATDTGSLFVRDAAGRWRSTGECPGWNPVVHGGRVFCSGNGMIRCRPLAAPAAAWEKWCDEPLGEKGAQTGQMFAAGGRLCMTIHPSKLYSRPFADLAQGWTLTAHLLWPDGLAAVGDRLFGNDRKRLYARPAADAGAEWVSVGPLPDGSGEFVADGDRLLTFGGPGPIFARPAAAGPDVPWTVVGRAHDPYAR